MRCVTPMLGGSFSRSPASSNTMPAASNIWPSRCAAPSGCSAKMRPRWWPRPPTEVFRLAAPAAVAAEPTRDVEGVDGAAGRARSCGDGAERRQLGEIGAHLVDKVVHGDRQEILAPVVADVVRQAPLVGDPGNRG